MVKSMWHNWQKRLKKCFLCFLRIHVSCCRHAQCDICTMSNHWNALKPCLRVSLPVLAFLLFGSFPSRQTCLRVCPCVYVCARVCVSVCVCVVGELHGFSKKEEEEASVNDVSPLADRGPPSSILKDCFRTWVTKESGALTHIPSSPFASTEKGKKNKSSDIPEHCLVEVWYKLVHFDQVSMSADILQYDYWHFIRKLQWENMLLGFCDSHCWSLPWNYICFRVSHFGQWMCVRDCSCFQAEANPVRQKVCVEMWQDYFVYI